MKITHFLATLAIYGLLNVLAAPGWVEERNPTFGRVIGFRKASTQPTILRGLNFFSPPAWALFN
ncbi:MAG: hypothetical protein KME60_05730 [Cyanomargarita calcarea GSE-NOS-MK-12-04C]|jgi:hypothetical protein|uniref:Uncharacterized protein n=1 Tax=Cyanomargarita calcarea GSE-NOS-MK-12-04C TaxID=2839659 RepID=A0A951URR5_9CYAN|nr:hypothetical protein [Cyanomargarita calcarea GSE-NOS-MK-12-04C]